MQAPPELVVLSGLKDLAYLVVLSEAKDLAPAADSVAVPPGPRLFVVLSAAKDLTLAADSVVVPLGPSLRSGRQKHVLDNPTDAIAREKQLKGWRRERKNELVRTMNPEWRDLMPPAWRSARVWSFREVLRCAQDDKWNGG